MVHGTRIKIMVPFTGNAHAPQRVVSRAFAVYHKFKSEGYSRLSLRITWPLLLLIGGEKNGRVYCDKQERQVAINGCCDKRGFTVGIIIIQIEFIWWYTIIPKLCDYRRVSFHKIVKFLRTGAVVGNYIIGWHGEKCYHKILNGEK